MYNIGCWFVAIRVCHGFIGPAEFIVLNWFPHAEWFVHCEVCVVWFYGSSSYGGACGRLRNGQVRKMNYVCGLVWRAQQPQVCTATCKLVSWLALQNSALSNSFSASSLMVSAGWCLRFKQQSAYGRQERPRIIIVSYSASSFYIYTQYCTSSSSWTLTVEPEHLLLEPSSIAASENRCSSHASSLYGRDEKAERPLELYLRSWSINHSYAELYSSFIEL